MNKIAFVAALAIALVSGNAAAIDLGIGLGSHQTGAASQAGSTSSGGSVAAIAGLTAQSSQAAATNGSFAGARFSNNNVANVSGSTGSTSQSGGAFALGGALSANQNQAVQQGEGVSQSLFQGGWIFVSP